MSDAKRSTLVKSLGVAIALATAFVLGLCVSSAPPRKVGAPVGATSAADVEEWTCPMHPQIRKDQPGSCPICGMDLVRVDTGEIASEADPLSVRDRVVLGEQAQKLARIRTREIKPMSTAARELRLLGRVDYDETRVKSVTAWTAGRIDRLLVATTGRTIAADQTIAKLYSPEIYAAQSDLIVAAKQVERLRAGNELSLGTAQAALAATRQRLRLLGVPAADVDAMQTADAPQKHIWIRSPFAGTVIQRLADEGAYVAAGAALYRIADLSRVWVQLDAYETDTPFLHVGDRVSLTVIGLPDQSFEGEVAFIDPVVNRGTRIVKVRVEVDNPRGDLKPGMFAEAVLHSDRSGAATLMLPRTAPLFTGQRSLVYVEVPDAAQPTYEAREVVLGERAGDWYPVLSGLEIGERVVVRGAFVIDADLQIKSGHSMMTREDDVARALRQPIADVPARVRSRLADILSAYLDAGAALRAGDLAGARQAATRLAQGVDLVTAEMPDKLRARWDDVARDLSDYARYLSGRDQLERARVAFRRLSELFLPVMQTFGNPLDQAISLRHCADDFEGSGAYWLQTTGDGDPYRDPAAGACSHAVAEVAPGAHLGAVPDLSRKKSAPPTAPRAGHQH